MAAGGEFDAAEYDRLAIEYESLGDMRRRQSDKVANGLRFCGDMRGQLFSASARGENQGEFRASS